MSRAARHHRVMGAAFGEALARDGVDGDAGRGRTLVCPQHRLWDRRTMDLIKLKLAELWQRESREGRTYYTGYMGGVRLVMLDAGEQPHPTREGETVRVWNLLAQERPQPSRRNPSARDQRSS
jgi:hypothetical protein